MVFVVAVISAVTTAIAVAPKVIEIAKKVRDFVNSPEFQAIWQKFKACFSRTPVAPMLMPETLGIRRLHLQTELEDSMKQVCDGMKGEEVVEFGLRAADMVSEVLDNCLKGVEEPRGSAALEDIFKRAAATARKLVDKHLEVGRKEALPDTSSVFEEKLPDPNNPQGPELRRIRVQRRNPPFENLVLRASGARGIGNAPALRALENLGKLSELKQVVGAADGALTAISLASGMSAGEFQKFCDDRGRAAMRDTAVDFAYKYPGVKLGTMQEARKNRGAEAGNALEIMDESSATWVSSHLNKHWQAIEQANLSGPERDRLQALKEQNFDTDRTRQMITFGDLALLHRLDSGKFKQLVLTGYNPGTKETVYFSAASHPDMPVALAGRIAVATPGIFKPVAYERQHYFGGATVGDMPSEGITAGLSGAALREANNKTLLLTCDESGNAYSMLHDDASAPDQASSTFMDWFKNAPAPSQKAHAMGLNLLPIYHGPLASDAPAEKIQEARTQALLMALEHIGKVMENSRQDLVEDEPAAARLLSAREQDRFLADHGASTAPLNVSMCDAIRALRQEPQAQGWLGALA